MESIYRPHKQERLDFLQFAGARDISEFERIYLFQIQEEFNEHIDISKATLEKNCVALEKAALMCINCLNEGGKIVLFGNGGSAADAQHIAAELVGRYKNERKAIC